MASPLLSSKSLTTAWQKALVQGDSSDVPGELALAIALVYPLRKLGWHARGT